MKGVYCLLINCRKTQLMHIGRLGAIEFEKGFYLYVGSALNGIEKRISRHLKKKKKRFWHIDYFLSNEYVNIDHIYCLESDKKMECNIALRVNSLTKSIKGFGSSDCKCRSHLFFTHDWKKGWENFLFS